MQGEWATTANYTTDTPPSQEVTATVPSPSHLGAGKRRFGWASGAAGPAGYQASSPAAPRTALGVFTVGEGGGSTGGGCAHGIRLFHWFLKPAVSAVVGLLFRRLRLHAVPSRRGTRRCQKRCVRGVGSEVRRLPSRPLGWGGLPTSLLHPRPLPKPASDPKPNASSYPGLPGSPSDPTHITGIKGARFHCNVFPFPVSVHPRNKLLCENGFEASQETACSFSGFENRSCFWLCLLKLINQQGFFGKIGRAHV